MKLAHVSFQIQTCTQLCTHGQGGRQTQSDGEDSRCPCRLGHTLPFSGAGPGQPSRRRLARARAPGLGWGSPPIEGLPAPGLQGWAGAALPSKACLHQGSRAGLGQPSRWRLACTRDPGPGRGRRGRLGVWGHSLPGLLHCRRIPYCLSHQGSPGGSVKSPPASAGDAGDVGSIPGSGRSSRERNGNPLQYSCLGNPLDRGAWCATVHGVAESRTRLSNQTTRML